MNNDASTISEILDSVDIESYLDSEGIEYRSRPGRTGPQLNIKDCPVCGSSSWKVFLNADTGLGNCFAGDHPPGENFNKWRFIKAHSGSETNKAAVQHIKAYALAQGWRPPKVKSERVVNATTGWQPPVSLELPGKNGRNLPYLENRGIPAVYVRYFHLRYCPDGSKFVYQDGNETKTQDYSRRILIPIYDLQGRLVTFQGRDTTGTKEQKYLFPPGLEGSAFHLYNGYNVSNARRIIINEGAFDVIATKMAMDSDLQLRDVVPIGTFGKHLSSGGTNDQLAKMLTLRARGCEEVTMMWDGEIRATDDAITAGLMLASIGWKVRVAMLPPLKDPNELTGAEVRRAFYEAEALTMNSALKIKMKRRQMNASVGK